MKHFNLFSLVLVKRVLVFTGLAEHERVANLAGEKFGGRGLRWNWAGGERIRAV